MRHGPRRSLGRPRSAGGLLLVLLLIASGGRGERGLELADEGPAARVSSVVASERDVPAEPTTGDAAGVDVARVFGEPRALAPVEPALPHLYDRIVMGEDHVFIGMPTDPTREDYGGSVIVHRRGDDGATAAPYVLEPPGEDLEAFGAHLALDGASLAVTADRRDPATGAREAVVHLFEGSEAGEWVATRAFLEGEGVGASSVTVALRAGLLAIGHRPSFSPSDAPGGGFRVGPAVRLFEREAGDAGSWSEAPPLLAPEREDGREGAFGAEVAIAPDGTLLAVADTAQQSDTGFGTYVYLFERSTVGEPWSVVRTFRDEELPSPYSAMLEIDDDTLVVIPMAARESTRADVAIFDRDTGGSDAWGRSATVTVEVSTPPDQFLPRHVLLASDLADDVLAVGIGPSGCMDLRVEPGPGPVPCAGGRVYVLEATDEPDGWTTRRVLEDPTGAERSTYGEYVALGPDGDHVLAGGVVLPTEGAAYTHADLYEREPSAETADGGP